MEWQPIETAPKDHVTVVDLWSGGFRYTNCAWGKPTYGKEYTWVQLNASRDSDGLVDEQVIPYPSHWMPLPEPPE